MQGTFRKTVSAGTKHKKRVIVRNINRVPKKQWDRWSPAARQMFNDLYEVTYDQHLVNAHPKTLELGQPAWKTVAWNVAWLAADFTDDVPVREWVKQVDAA